MALSIISDVIRIPRQTVDECVDMPFLLTIYVVPLTPPPKECKSFIFINHQFVKVFWQKEVFVNIASNSHDGFAEDHETLVGWERNAIGEVEIPSQHLSLFGRRVVAQEPPMWPTLQNVPNGLPDGVLVRGVGEVHHPIRGHSHSVREFELHAFRLVCQQLHRSMFAHIQ